MNPIPINYLAVLVCGVFSMVLGFLWYGPFFSKPWMKYMGITKADMEKFKASGKSMGPSYGFMFAASLIMAFVLAHSLIFASAYLQVEGIPAGLQAGFWNWLGFVMPATLGSVLFEKKHWKVWVINLGYYLVLLCGMGVILALWK